MSFNVPQDVPSYSSAEQRATENAHWRHKQTHSQSGFTSRGNGIGARFGGMLKPNEDLPMYKDKPHFAAGRRRQQGIFSRRRLWAGLALCVLTIYWWTRPSSSSGPREHGPGSGTSVPGQGSKTSGLPKTNTEEWEIRRQAVKDVFSTSWDGYEKDAWGMDEYSPISRKGRNMVEGGMGWIIVDALDTAMIMNLTTRVRKAREWISTSLHYTADHDVNTFETTIRMLGGLLSAHYLSNTYPELAPLEEDDMNQPGEDLYIEKATDLADRLLGAFESPSGIPYSSVNLNTSEGIASGLDAGSSSTAEAATLQLEMKYLAKLTGEPLYWQRAEVIMQVIDSQQREDGLLPIFINPATGTFRGQNIRFGSRGDSYYEYLIKQYLQTGNREPIYLDMWNEALEGVKKHLIAYTKNAKLTVLAERENGLHLPLTPKMDHLVCFMPGTIALGLTGGQTIAEAKTRLGTGWTPKHDESLKLAEELMKTCWGMYKVTATGLAPEISYFKLNNTPEVWRGHEDPTWTPPVSTELSDDPQAEWRQDYDIHSQDVHNLQRPETVESLLYMYRITQDPKYREWGWEMFSSFREHTQVVDEISGQVYGYTSLDTVMESPIPDRKKRDNMESFWMSETLKYFYLLFSPDDFMNLRDVVFNTEAHPFPRFDIQGSKIFKTGWERLARQKVLPTEATEARKDMKNNAVVSAAAPVLSAADSSSIPTTQENPQEQLQKPRQGSMPNSNGNAEPNLVDPKLYNPPPVSRLVVPAAAAVAGPNPAPSPQLQPPRRNPEPENIPAAVKYVVPESKLHLHDEEEHMEQYERITRAVPSSLSKGV